MSSGFGAVQGFAYAAGRSVTRPSRVWAGFRKRSWSRAMEVQLRPEQALALGRALITAARALERERKARQRARKAHA